MNSIPRLAPLFPFLFLSLLLCLVPVVPAHASADSEWQEILRLDAGPNIRLKERSTAVEAAHAHLLLQQKAMETFLARYPSDPRANDANMRLAAILITLGKLDNRADMVKRGESIYTAIESATNTPASRRADAAFALASLQMQGMRDRVTGLPLQKPIAGLVRSFAAQYPDDRRSPRLLVEASTVCDSDPALKTALLNEARALSKQDDLNARIADDLKRIGFLGKKIDLSFDTIGGGHIDIADGSAPVTALLFWAASSPQSVIWLRDFRDFARSYRDRGLRVVAISLDDQRSTLDSMREQLHLTWPIAFDGKGWRGPLARPFGINAVPTLWLIDSNGVLRDLNARDTYRDQIPALLGR